MTQNSQKKKNYLIIALLIIIFLLLGVITGLIIFIIKKNEPPKKCDNCNICKEGKCESCYPEFILINDKCYENKKSFIAIYDSKIQNITIDLINSKYKENIVSMTINGTETDNISQNIIL